MNRRDEEEKIRRDEEEHTRIENGAEAVAGENVANNQEPAVEGTTDPTPIHVDSANLRLKVEYLSKMAVVQMNTIKVITEQLRRVQDSTAEKPTCCKLPYLKVSTLIASLK